MYCEICHIIQLATVGSEIPDRYTCPHTLYNKLDSFFRSYAINNYTFIFSNNFKKMFNHFKMHQITLFFSFFFKSTWLNNYIGIIL